MTAPDRWPVATEIGKLRPQQRIRVTGLVRAVTAVPAGGSVACRCTLADDSGEADLMFLGRARVPGLEPGTRCTAEGMAAARGGRIVIWNPRYEITP